MVRADVTRAWVSRPSTRRVGSAPRTSPGEWALMKSMRTTLVIGKGERGAWWRDCSGSRTRQAPRGYSCESDWLEVLHQFAAWSDEKRVQGRQAPPAVSCCVFRWAG